MATAKGAKGGKSGKGGTQGPFEALRGLRDRLEKESPAPPRKPPPQAPRRPAREEPEDEALLLHRLYGGVEPLDRSRGRVPRQNVERPSPVRPARIAAQAEAENDEVRERLRALVEGGDRFEVSDDGRRVEGRRSEVPLSAVRDLRRGLLPIDARLDLHGLRMDEALAEIERFLAATRGRGERCVLLIHGKGEHSPLGRGVLRGEIAAWLSQAPPSRHVAAFATARPEDGGDGAVYVLLRR